jgi:GNAT superfamily N-acetyltransferase
MTDARNVDNLLFEWFDWKPSVGRLGSIRRAVRNGEILVAESASKLVGFIHYAMHEDIIDGGPNTFITAFYVSEEERGKGVGSLLLERAIADSLARCAVGVETSTTHRRALQLYERHHFKQTVGDIGEVFLELDIPEYLQAKKSRDATRQ